MRSSPLLPAALAALALAACGREPAPGPAQASPPAAAPAEAPPDRAPPHARATPPTGSRREEAGCPDAGAGPEPEAAALQAFVHRRAKDVRGCYDRALKRDPELHGRLVVRFTVGRCGELSGVAVAGRRAAAPDLRDCLAHALRAWRTPFRPAEPVEVEYPFSFTAR